MKNKIAIDIGGTNTRIGLIDEKNKIVKVTTIATDVNNFNNHLKKMKEVIDNLLIKQKSKQIALISVCCPGPIDERNGNILYLTNFKWGNNFPITKLFKDSFSEVEFKLTNDSRAAALGQYNYFKNEKGAKIFYFVTISTGIGSSIIINGKVYSGISGVAGEVAKTMITDNSLQGIEDYCSGTGIMNHYHGKCKNIAELFKSNENNDVNYLNEIKFKLASFLATAVGFLNPGLIVIGGSVAEKNVEFMEAIFTITKEMLFKATKPTVNFKVAENTLEKTLIGLVL